jgi:hypothetical protein
MFLFRFGLSPASSSALPLKFLGSTLTIAHSLSIERSRSEFYYRRTASKIISLMKDDKRIIKQSLRALTALSADRKLTLIIIAVIKLNQ